MSRIETIPASRRRHALAALVLALATQTEIDASSPHAGETDARRIVHATVERQLEALERTIFDHESAAPRTMLVRRRFTVETFLLAGLVPQAVAFADRPDLAPLWRFDFRDEPRPLEGPSGWPGRSTLIGVASASAVAGSFLVEQLEPVGGDDAVAIGGRFVATPDSVALVATWCEPCLHAASVDFPIMPEAFLLAWDRDTRSIGTLLPSPMAHREQVDHALAALDQPEDLYDLFDGLRPLGSVRPDDPRLAAFDASGRDDREPRGPTIHVGRAATDAERQRVEVEPIEGGLVVTIRQPPVSCRWRSGLRYDLQGDVAGVPMPSRRIVPEGEIDSLTGTVEASFRIRRGGIVGELRRDGRILARLRWSSIEACTHEEAIDQFARLRGPFDSAWTSSSDETAPHELNRLELHHRTALSQLDRLDPIGSELRRLRQELLAAVRDDDRDAMLRAFERHRGLLAELALDPSTSWRSCEQLAEALAESADRDRLARWLDGPCSLALASPAAETLAELLRDRIAMGRFGAAAWLAATITTRDDATDRERSWAANILPTLLDVLRSSEGPLATQSPRPPWWEPLGREALGVAIAERLDPSPDPTDPHARAWKHPRSLGSAFELRHPMETRP
ncbi:MAG: hypothetical protein ACO3Y3_07755 [Phycisphaerales bacterium]